jgi:putative restriction endonuclease
MATADLTSASPEWTRWLERRSSLRPDKSHRALGPAPHKALLLLVVLDLTDEGKLAGAVLRKYGDLAFRFSSYWRIVAGRRGTKPNVGLPFFHLGQLRSAELWSAAACCRFPPPRPCSQPYLSAVIPASKLACRKAAASCRTPKLRKFALRVLPAYDYTSARTRYRMIALNGKTALDAAHIHPFKEGGGNPPTNGIALSKTAHWLFDRGFW